MLKTNIGEFFITINGEEVKFIPNKLSLKGKNFVVDGRYKIDIDNIEIEGFETIVDCIIKNPKLSEFNIFSESGENLALISFIQDKRKLSIGVEGDLPGVSYEYLKDRLRIKIKNSTNLSSLTVFVAWIIMDNEGENDINTWFAADPTLTV